MKTKRKVILAGGSGFLGGVLAEQLTNAGYEVVILSRRAGESKGTVRTVFWDGMTEGVWCDELEGAEALINLAGRSVDCRYTQKNRRLILESRVKGTRVLSLAVKNCAIPPKLWVNAASATIYADTCGERPANTETDGVIGEGFSVGVCREWEAEFNRCMLPQTKQVCLRVAITLGAEGGAMVPLMNLARFGIGGRQGDGEQ
ncbi:MAG: NAD-dependent epimerase/dehydratase family protein [Opitutaceae bacterium]